MCGKRSVARENETGREERLPRTNIMEHCYLKIAEMGLGGFRRLHLHILHELCWKSFILVEEKTQI